MIWVLYGVFVAAVVVIGYFADRYARRNGLGFYAAKHRKPSRHANTGEFKVVEHKLADDWTYTTADIPKITEDPGITTTAVLSVQDQVQAGLDYMERRYTLPPVPVRTDTVMMEAVDPTKYPNWIKENTP